MFGIPNTPKTLSTCPLNRRCPSGVPGRSPETKPELLQIAHRHANSHPAAAEPEQGCDLSVPPLPMHPPSALTCVRHQMLLPLRYKMLPSLGKKRTTKHTEADKHIALHLSTDQTTLLFGGMFF